MLTINKFAKNISVVPKAKPHNITAIIEYVSGAIATETIIHKITGNIRAFAFDIGHSLTEKVSPFDTFIQILEGKAEIIIRKESFLLETGQFLVVPAHSSLTIKARGRFKMLSAIVKSGYEDQ